MNSDNEIPSLEHQDWTKVVIHGKSSNNKLKNNITKPIVHKDHNSILLAKLDQATDVDKIKSISLTDRQNMISMRVAKGLKQVDVNKSLCFPANLYKDIESGKTIPTLQQLNKINIFLKTNFKLI